jgi:cell division protein FtsB
MKKRLGFSEKSIVQWLILFCSIIVITLSLIGDKGYLQLMALKEKEQNLEQEIKNLEHEKREWIDKIQSLKKNKSYIETIAREQLGMVRKDETVLRLEFIEKSPEAEND